MKNSSNPQAKYFSRFAGEDFSRRRHFLLATAAQHRIYVAPPYSVVQQSHFNGTSPQESFIEIPKGSRRNVRIRCIKPQNTVQSSKVIHRIPPEATLRISSGFTEMLFEKLFSFSVLQLQGMRSRHAGEGRRCVSAE